MKPISDVREMSPNQLVSWFMIASYAYYVLGEPLMSDAAFDLLVMRLKENWDTADHYHKALIKPGNLEAGSGFDLHYPTIVKDVTWKVLDELGLR